jgi:2-aminoethylphosphonate-pyruvate transaminase
VAFVLLSPRAQERLRETQRRSLYLDLLAYLDAQAQATVPFTPAIPAMYGLEAALTELLEEGLSNRQLAYARRMEFLDQELSKLGLEARVAAPHRSRSVRSLTLPLGITYDALHDALKREGYVIYAGLGSAAKSSFRVCTLGNISINALAGFAQCLETTLSRLAQGHPVQGVQR